MEIKVLGPGCAKCKSTYNVIQVSQVALCRLFHSA